MESNLSIINNRADILGLLFLDDGATIFITPLLNILVSGKNLPVAVFKLVGCQGNLPDGGGKCGSFI